MLCALRTRLLCACSSRSRSILFSKSALVVAAGFETLRLASVRLLLFLNCGLEGPSSFTITASCRKGFSNVTDTGFSDDCATLASRSLDCDCLLLGLASDRESTGEGSASGDVCGDGWVGL